MESLVLATIAAAAMLAAPLPTAAQPAPQLISGSTVPSAIPPNADSNEIRAVSGDDRYVVFSSRATNLVANDTNNTGDVFVFDRVSSLVERVSVSSDGTQANGASLNGAMGITADGRFVVFASSASNLVAGDTNGVSDIFLRDRQEGTTTLLSRTATALANGTSSNPVITPDGRFVAFETAANNLVTGDVGALFDVVRLDRQDGSFLAASQNGAVFGNNTSSFPSMSDDGRFVAFTSTASNLVAGDTNAMQDIFRHDFSDRSVIRVSVADGGAQLAAASFPNGSGGLQMSADGSRVFFATSAAAVPADTNGAFDIYLRVLPGDSLVWVTEIPDGGVGGQSVGSIDRSGTRICYHRAVVFGSEVFLRAFVRTLPLASPLAVLDGFPADPNIGACGVFSPDGGAVYIMASLGTPQIPTAWQTPRRIDLATLAVSEAVVALPTPLAAGNGSARSLSLGLADDGRTFAFASQASNLVPGDANGVGDIFVRDADTGATTRISLTAAGGEADCRAIGPRMSRTGRYVVFQSCAALVPADNNGVDDVYRFDRNSGTLDWVSEGVGSVAADGRSWDASVANDGTVTFTSCASNLLAGDTNGVCDVFVRPVGGAIARVPGTIEPDGASQTARITPDGLLIAFASAASNLVTGDSNGSSDVFVFDRQGGTVERVSVATAGTQANGASSGPEITEDGRRVSFVSAAPNLANPLLAAGTSGIFVRDRTAATTTLLTKNAAGTIAWNGTVSPRGGHRLSDDGRWLALATSGANIFAAPANTSLNRAVLRDNDTGEARNLSSPAPGQDADNTSLAVAMTPDGAVTIFDSFAGNLTSDDLNFRIPDVFRVGVPLLTAIATPASIVFGATSTLSTTGGSGTGAVTFAVTAGSTFCEVAGTTLTGIGVGTCTVTATKAADANNNAATATVEVTVSRANQSPLTAIATPASIVFGGSSTLSTTGGSGTGAVTYAITAGGSFCSITGTTLTGTGVGSCTVTATKAQDANFNAANATVVVTVSRANQAPLTAIATPASIVFGGTSTLSTTGGSGTGAVTYAITAGGSFCSITGTTLTGTGVGSCTVTATKAQDANFNAATASTDVMVSRANQAPLTAIATPASILSGGTSSLSTTGGSGTGAVTYAITAGGSFCSITGTTLTGTGVGSCTATATKAQDANFNAATATVNVTVLATTDPATDLEVSKTDGTPWAIPNAFVVYEILVANAGPTAVTGARVQDPLPAGLADALWTCAPVQIATCPAASGSGGIDQLVDLPVNGVLRYVYSARVTAALGATITNTVTVSPPAGVVESDPADNTATDVNTVVSDGVFLDGFEPTSPGISVPFRGP